MKYYLEGMVSIFRFMPLPKRGQATNLDGFQEDGKALRGDWEQVGGCIRHAMEQEQTTACPK